MKNIYIIYILFCVISCGQKLDNKSEKRISQREDICMYGKDTIDFVIRFTPPAEEIATKKMQEAIAFLEGKGEMDWVQKEGIKSDTAITIIQFLHCKEKNRTIEERYILQNILAKKCRLKSHNAMKESGENYYPNFYFSQWYFANNQDRDSAYNIVYPIYCSEDYEKAYISMVKGDNSLYIFSSMANAFCTKTDEYRKYWEEFLKKQ